ncbi:MAG: hypothetical protein GX051_08180 [Clostridiales bacterium]|nr:hypothetical protein [Clostridiales bacterium]
MSEAIMDALRCMLTGMTGIFTVTTVIILCIKLLNALTRETDEDSKQ